VILHCVFCRFRADVPPERRLDILVELSGFALSLDGVVSCDFGPNRDFERKSQDYSDGFVIRFSNRRALDRYADHPGHRDLGRRLCELCVGGAEGILVFDLEANQGTRRN